MSDTNMTHEPKHHYYPIVELTVARLRESYRRPETVFWVYGFPILMIASLGTAFRSRPVEKFVVDIQAGETAERLAGHLRADERFEVEIGDALSCRTRLRVGQTDLLVIGQSMAAQSAAAQSAAAQSATAQSATAQSATAQSATAQSMTPSNAPISLEYLLDPTRPKSVLARSAVDDTLQRAAGRRDPVAVHDQEIQERGGRYIDFLVPGLLGMSLLGGGLWGVGFATVDMRLRKLLKRLVATPMGKGQFLTGVMLSRLLFLIPEMTLMVLFATIVFGVVNFGSWFAVLFLLLLGGTTFAGVGLLVASRAQTLETVSGLMNLVMLPQWICSGIFFSPDRFPDFAQPFIRILPLTPLISSLRAVMLEGATLSSRIVEIGILGVWATVAFALALRWFRWT